MTNIINIIIKHFYSRNIKNSSINKDLCFIMCVFMEACFRHEKQVIASFYITVLSQNSQFWVKIVI